MSTDWTDFLADDVFDLPQWPESAYEQDMPADRFQAASIAPLFDYPPLALEEISYGTAASASAWKHQRDPSSVGISGRTTTAASKQTGMANTIDLEQLQTLPEVEANTKRTKNNTDNISSCWTSPLCPNHGDADGSYPDPSTCGAACAPFLFANLVDPLVTPVDEVLQSQEISIEKEPSVAADPIATGMMSSRKSIGDGSQGEAQRPSTSSKSTGSGLNYESPSQGEETSPDASHDVAENITGKPRQRQPHNQVERKYRESLNTQLEALRKVVPSLRPRIQNGAQTADIEDLPVPTKPSKAVILASATAYIRQVEKEKKQMVEENKQLKARVAALSALVKCDDCSLMQYVMNLNITSKQ